MWLGEENRVRLRSINPAASNSLSALETLTVLRPSCSAKEQIVKWQTRIHVHLSRDFSARVWHGRVATHKSFCSLTQVKFQRKHGYGRNGGSGVCVVRYSEMLITSSWSRNQKQRVCNENWWVPILQSQKSTKQVLNCVNKLRSPILVLDFPRSGESSGGGLAPHHWHFSHPVFVMTGLRVTEVPLWSTGRLNYSLVKEHMEDFWTLTDEKHPSTW